MADSTWKLERLTGHQIRNTWRSDESFPGDSFRLLRWRDWCSSPPSRPPSLPSKTSAFFKTRLLSPRISVAPSAKFADLSVPSASYASDCSFFVKQDGPISVSSFRSSSSPSSLSFGWFAPPCSSIPIVPSSDTSRGAFYRGRRSDEFLQKVATAGLLALLFTIVLTLIHPVLAPPAYAAFQNTVANTGGKLSRAELFASAWTGFFAGCLHTLSGPDHLAALAPLSIGRTRTESAIVGALWGCGHDAGQLIFGMLFLLLKDRLHIEVIRTWGTRVVGFTLLVIGAMGIKEASDVPSPCVTLENGECDVSTTELLDNSPSGKKKIGFATFATGIVHGLQPDALMMILPALALPSRLAGAAFLGMFLLGTVFAMGSYTVFLGSCSQALKERVPKITEKLTWAASLVAITMGIAILVSQFFGFSLY